MARDKPTSPGTLKNQVVMDMLSYSHYDLPIEGAFKARVLTCACIIGGIEK